MSWVMNYVDSMDEWFNHWMITCSRSQECKGDSIRRASESHT